MRASVIAWLAWAAAVLAAGAAGLALGGQAGPWLPAAAVLAATTIVTGLVAAIAARRLAGDNARLNAHAQEIENERERLQRELHRHGQLEQQLRQAKQAAESAVLAKGEFLATMSHEIRTPLNGIVPMLDLLSHAPLAADQREMLATASASSRQLLRIVDDILDYSKLEASKLELETTAFNLRELLDGVLQLMRRPAESKGLKLGLQLDSAVRLSVRGDPVRLRQVLGNLLNNAVKFTERGFITVNVQRLGETASQHRLRFEVRDTGIGIDAEAQSRLFASFSQADASTTRLYGGTGLGLAICRRIVELMGGRIGVVSEPGRGSNFWFEIPLLKAIGDLSGNPHDALSGRALLVSPDPRLRQRLNLLLPTWGLQLNTVETAQEALERLRVTPGGYSHVIGDLSGLPGGARALHRGVLRARANFPIHLIWLYGTETIPEELREAATLLSRQPHEADLRAALSTAMAAADDSAASVTGNVEPVSSPHTGVTQAQPATTVDMPIAQPAPPSRLLLVEDNPVNLAVAEKLLSTLGHHCEHAGNGEIALGKMIDNDYDLVLMDCQMPVLDGYATTRRWRQIEAQRPGAIARLPIVAMTANAMAEDRQRCLDAGMDDYLSKPVSREALSQCLQRWLSPAGEGRTPIADTGPTDTPSLQSNAVEAYIATTSELSFQGNFPVLDHAMLGELHDIAGDETTRIISLFLEDAPRLITQLEKAAADSDLETMREAAHTLKSSSANVGAMALSAAAKRIELGARANKLERPAVAVARVIAEYARVRIGLHGYIALLNRQAAADQAAQSSSLVSR